VRCVKQHDVLTTITLFNDPAFSGIANPPTSTALLVVSPHVLLEPKILNASSHFVYLTPKRPHDASATASDAFRLRLEPGDISCCTVPHRSTERNPSNSFVLMKHSKQLRGRQTYTLFVPHLPTATDDGAACRWSIWRSAAHALNSLAAHPDLPPDTVNALQQPSHFESSNDARDGNTISTHTCLYVCTWTWHCLRVRNRMVQALSRRYRLGLNSPDSSKLRLGLYFLSRHSQLERS
jgi:hypothetical protein